MSWHGSLDHTLRSSAYPGPVKTWGLTATKSFPQASKEREGAAAKGFLASSPIPGVTAGWGEQTHPPHLNLSVFFEFVFPLTYFPFSLGFKNSLLSECRRSQQSPHHGSYGMHLEKGKNSNGVVIRCWTGLDMAWLEFQSWLLFAFVMKHLLYELLLLLLEQLLPRNPLSGCVFSWTWADCQRPRTGPRLPRLVIP